LSIEFLVTSLIVVATPGTGVLYTIAAGFSHGARASVIAAVGCTLGVIPHMVAAITGLAALLHTSATAFQTLKYLGVAYLLYLAWSTLRDKGALAVEKKTTPRSATKVIVSAILVNLLNPKLTIFFFAFLPQFVSTDEPNAFLRMVGLSAVFMVLTLVVFVGYGYFAAAIRNHVISRPRVVTWMRRVFAGTFAALGARLAFTDR
jgi:threonine/homoserine/homoserine lactone efflux protein